MNRFLIAVLLTGAFAAAAMAQAQTNTEIRRGEVVYVSGNDLVVKMESGETKHFTVPSSFVFKVTEKTSAFRICVRG